MSFSSRVFFVHCPCSLDSLSAPQQLAAHCAGTNVPILEQEKAICIHEKKKFIYLFIYNSVFLFAVNEGSKILDLLEKVTLTLCFQEHIFNF